MAAKSVSDAELLERARSLSLDELCRVCDLRVDTIVEMVEYGILEPTGRRQPEWRFPAMDLVRAKRVLRLVHDLQINFAGAALALDLIEQMDTMRRQMDTLEQRLRQAFDEI